MARRPTPAQHEQMQTLAGVPVGTPARPPSYEEHVVGSDLLCSWLGASGHTIMYRIAADGSWRAA
jgi:hypothetical protein